MAGAILTVVAGMLDAIRSVVNFGAGFFTE
jgi:hypothetical protein